MNRGSYNAGEEAVMQERKLSCWRRSCNIRDEAIMMEKKLSCMRGSFHA